MHFFRHLSLISAAVLMSACAHTTQMTSGADYLSRYQDRAVTSSTAVDQAVRDIAMIEPDLQFPARIGLARIEHGRLTSIPEDEADVWHDFAEQTEAAYGEFVPVSPFIASMVSTYEPAYGEAGPVIDHIRKGAARQHLDYVLVYEVDDRSTAKSNALRATDLTLLGLYLFPSRKVEVRAQASAVLIDVRNGYPYGTASAFAGDDAVVTFAGQGTARTNLRQSARQSAVAGLIGDLGRMMADLAKHPAAGTDQLSAELTRH